VNAPFRIEATPTAEELPLWQQPWLLELLKSAAAPVALALVALVIILKLIRPALLAMLAKPEPPPGSQIDEVVADEEPPHVPALPMRNTDKLEAARVMAKENPAAVANIVRGWVNGSA
jgi:flagellar M-ring protein FliF